MSGKYLLVPHLFSILLALVGCAPVALISEPTATSSTVSESVETAAPAFTQTLTFTTSPTASPTLTLTATMTFEPTATQPLILPSAVQPTRTRRTNRQNTHTPTATLTLTPTLEPTATGTAPASSTATATRCPIPSREPFYVEPVTSPTDQLSQLILVRIGQGEDVTIVTESGTFTVTRGSEPFPPPVEITLLPNTVHHLQVSARVRIVFVNGCQYGGYTLTTTTDRHGAPLTIVQGSPAP